MDGLMEGGGSEEESSFHILALPSRPAPIGGRNSTSPWPEIRELRVDEFEISPLTSVRHLSSAHRHPLTCTITEPLLLDNCPATAAIAPLQTSSLPRRGEGEGNLLIVETSREDARFFKCYSTTETLFPATIFHKAPVSGSSSISLKGRRSLRCSS